MIVWDCGWLLCLISHCCFCCLWLVWLVWYLPVGGLCYLLCGVVGWCCGWGGVARFVYGLLVVCCGIVCIVVVLLCLLVGELWCVIYCLVSCLVWVAIQLVGYLVASGCLLVGCVALFLLIVVWLNSVVFIGSFVLVFVA